MKNLSVPLYDVFDLYQIGKENDGFDVFLLLFCLDF